MIPKRLLILAGLLLLVSPPSLRAQRDLARVPDPDPELERRSFQIADGFEVNLFAADPIIAKPIQMNFDSRGRLWIASSEVYPQILPGQVANDKVVVLEDRDGDGRSDATTVFADGLLIPTGIEPGDGGAYVANSTELLHFRDTDGDGRADRRRVMLSGFGTEDTHHILHTLRWGFDGRLYFNQSIYIHSHVETPWGVRRLGGGGIWRFRPESVDLEVFIRGLVNPWGHHFDRWGQSFATDGAGGEGINYVFPGATFTTAPDAVRILAGLNPGSPKYCGEEVVGGRHLPPDWQGNIITNDFRGNRVCRFVLTEDGAGFAAREQPELIKTSHVAFRPIDVKMGPDGAIYIADWYNPIIQHGEVDFRDPRRDHTHGRIWRVTARGRPLVERPRLVGASTEALLDALKAPEDWTRLHARRQLQERGASVRPALDRWVARLDPADPATEPHRLEALWTYQALDLAEPTLLDALLRAKDPRVRAAACRVAGDWRDRLENPIDRLAPLVADDHPRVRLEAVRALARVPQPHAVKVALRALDRPIDRFLDHALWLTARDLEPVWLPALSAGRLDFGGNARHLTYALEAVGSPLVVRPLWEAFQAGRIPADQQEQVLALIASLGGPKELGAVLDLALDRAARPSGQRARLFEALAEAARRKGARPEGDLERLGRALDETEEPVRVAAVRLAGAWKVEPLRSRLGAIATASDAGTDLRRAAIEAIARLGGRADRDLIDRIAAETDSPVPIRTAAVLALAALDPQAAAARGVDLLASVSLPDHGAEVFAGLLERREGASTLAAALNGRTLPPEVARAGLRAVRGSARPEPALVNALTRSGGLSPAQALPDAAERQRLLAAVATEGDPARGEAIFRRKALDCLKCHAIAGAGGRVGPDLASIGASAPADYLLDSILEPGKAIKENYHSLVVATDDGRVLTGIPVRRTDTELVLRDAEDREVAIPRASIEEQANGGSLMPTGLADSLSRGELIDLVRFLSELGKVGPYAVSKARIARRWEVLEPSPRAAERLRGDALDPVIGDSAGLTWTPAYTRVSGDLPLEDVPGLQHGARRIGLARCTLDVTAPGPVRLVVNSTPGMTFWIDATRIPIAREMTLEVKPGRHTLTFEIDHATRREDLRVDLEEVPGSTARAEFVLGK